jgi:membrane peptidoglycan carboxypeptidase
VEAASEGYFGKPAKDMTLAEASLLAGIPQSPAAFDPVNNLDAALARRNEVLDLIARHASIRIGEDVYYSATPEEIEAARNTPIEIRQARFPIQAPHFVLTYLSPLLEQLVGKDALVRDGLVVHTTLDLALQEKVQGILERYIAQYEGPSNSHNGASLVIEPSTGEILVMIGSRDYYNEQLDGNVNNLLAPNSPGSSFKPFMYLTGIVKNGWNPSTIFQDTPTSFRESDGTVFTPQNPVKNTYLGNVTMRTALGNSLNVTAFKAAQAVGVSNIISMARSMGFTGLDGFYGPAIAIGGVDLKAFDLVYGYSTLANGGVMIGQDAVAPTKPTERRIEPVSILRIEDRGGKVIWDINDHRAQKRIVSAEQVFMISSILSDPGATCVTFGCGGVSVPGYQVAVKTGTSSPYDQNGPNKDRIGETWAFGFTPDYVVGVWAGNSDNTPIVNIFSTTIAFQVMRDTMIATYNGRPGRPFTQPEGLVRRQVCAPAPAPTAQPNQPNQPNQPPPPNVCTDELVLRNSPQAQETPAASPTPGPQNNNGNNNNRGQAVPNNNGGGGGASGGGASGGGVVITGVSGGSGSLTVNGTASTPAMQSYQLQIGIGTSPTNWSVLGQWTTKVENGVLGTVSTGNLARGAYTIRLVVIDGQQGPLTSTSVITVQ